MSGSASPTVRFARLEQRGVLLGLGGAQVVVLAAAATVSTGSVYVAGAQGVVTSSPIWLLLLLVGVGRADSRPLVTWIPLLTAWATRGLTGGTTWRARTGRVAIGELQVPGVPGALAVQELDDGTAVVREGAAWCVVVEVAGRGFTLAGPSAQQRMVGGWGQALAWACRQPDVLRVQVLHRGGPGGAAAVRRWWADHGADAPSPAARLVTGLLAEVTADRYECFVALALRRGAAVPDLLAAFTDALAAAEIEVVGPVGSARLQRLLRAGYDPVGSLMLEEHSGTPAGAVGGPIAMGFAEEWDRVRTDSAWHAVYWVSEWPRTDVHAGFLQPLLLAPGTHRCFSLVAEPLPLAEAMREIRRAKADHVADSAQRARLGQVEDESVRAEAADVLRREQELVAGHGDLRFVGLLSVSARSSDELDGASAGLEAAAARAMCEVRRLVGQQLPAHAAACLPLARRVT